jgi:hypothetical protein
MSNYAMSNRGQGTSGACWTLACDPDAAEPSSAATIVAAAMSHQNAYLESLDCASMMCHTYLIIPITIYEQVPAYILMMCHTYLIIPITIYGQVPAYILITCLWHWSTHFVWDQAFSTPLKLVGGSAPKPPAYLSTDFFA